jgi:glycosyltransferase involved in cell wall biosynthesis
MRVMHVITALNFGGAEEMLHRLLEASDPELSHEVVCLTELGPVGRRIQQLGVKTHALGMPRVRFPSPLRMLRLVGLIRDFRPDVVQTWMYHADLLGGVAAKLAGGAKIFWGLHNSTLHPRTTRRTTWWTVAACARLSHVVPDGIVSVSRAARDLHVALGYAGPKFVLIPNGFDLTRFRPDPAARSAVREELGVDPGAVVIGLSARVDPQKDHATFVRAAALLARRRPDVRFLLCGDGATAENRDLVQAIAERRLLERFLLLGRRTDVPRILSAIDIGTLSSAYGEAFPLAIGEAMACGAPCVVTDVGDCADLVGDTGRVVPPRDPDALAQAWEALVSLGEDGRRRLGFAARERIAARFSLPRIVAEYAGLYRQAIGGTGAPTARGRAGATG